MNKKRDALILFAFVVFGSVAVFLLLDAINGRSLSFQSAREVEVIIDNGACEVCVRHDKYGKWNCVTMGDKLP